MRKWILMIFYVNSSLDKFCEKIDNKIEKLALNMTQPCNVLYEKIIILSQKKDDLINLRVLHNSMTELLSKEEVTGVKEAAYKFFNDSQNNSCFRGKIRVFRKCAEVLLKAGYCIETLAKTYSYLLPKRRKVKQQVI